MTLWLGLLVAHWLGDFLFQSDDMAIRKSKEWDALTSHVLVYGITLWVVLMLAAFGLEPWQVGPWVIVVTFYVFMNSLAHFVQDAITSRITARLWFFRLKPGIYQTAPYVVPANYETVVNPWVFEGGSRHWFFVAIGFDQLLHYVTLFVMADWWLRP